MRELTKQITPLIFFQIAAIRLLLARLLRAPLYFGLTPSFSHPTIDKMNIPRQVFDAAFATRRILLETLTPSSFFAPRLVLATVALLVPHLSHSQESKLPNVEVTATRLGLNVDAAPADLSVIDGKELRARGAFDLRSALALVSGVEAPPGGDTGPAGAVPSFWGLHEFDAFLLVVDGIPWGGAFNPSIGTLNLNNVERIEVLKGAAPVSFGATSFVGVIHVIHYPAGQSANLAEITYGSHGATRGAFSVALPTLGGYSQSLAIDAHQTDFADKRERVKGGNLMYRGSNAVGDGVLRIDANLTFQRQTPPSPTIREGTALTTLTSPDANYNPTDARIDQNRYHLSLSYSLPTLLGTLDTTLSAAHSQITDIRGFLRSSLIDDGSSENADSQHQNRNILDSYFDTHLSTNPSKRLKVVYGFDVLYGRASQASMNGAYYAPLTGPIALPSTVDLHVDEINRVLNRRTFIGEYVQADYTPNERWEIVSGLRLNQTSIKSTSSHTDGFDPTENLASEQKQNKSRLSGQLGASYRLSQQGADHAVVYADYRNAFKPPAIDFGPDYTPNILKPETAQIYEAGFKGKTANGHLTYNASLFWVNFQNLVLQTVDANGAPLLQNGGAQKLNGAEVELRFEVDKDLTLAAALSHHNARFTSGAVTKHDVDVDLTGKQLTLAPHVLASMGFIYTPAQAWRATTTASYVGRRYLDLANTALTSAYTTFDASLGYHWGKYSSTLRGTNLTNKRPPVTASEFGDSSYYLLPGRTVSLTLGVSL